MAISNGFLLTTETEVCLAGTVKDRTILGMKFTNNDTIAHVISIYAYPTGGSMSDMYCINKNWNIPAGDTLEYDSNDKIILQPNAKITAICDTASKVSIFVNYRDI